MANAVVYTNLLSESRNNVVALITVSNIADPGIVSTEYRKRIYSRYPDVKAADFAGYPFLVVHPAQFDPDEGGSLDGKHKFVSWIIEIEIITSDRGYGENDGKGLTHMDSISDDVLQTFLSMTNRATLSDNNMKFSNPKTTSVVTEDFNNERIYRRSIILNFKNRIPVSA